MSVGEVMFKDILRDESSKVLGDVLRTLYLFSGTLWLPELYNEYVGFVRTLNEEPESYEEIKSAVEELGRMGLVRVTEGVRGTAKPEGEKTLLISLKDDRDLRSALSMDSRVNAYISEWRKYFSSRK